MIKLYAQDKSKIDFQAHYSAVSDLNILKKQANKRELLGGHSSERKSIEQSLTNFIGYFPQFEKANIWDNPKEFKFNSVEERFVFENENLTFRNTHLTKYSNKLLNIILDKNEEQNIQRKSGFRG